MGGTADFGQTAKENPRCARGRGVGGRWVEFLCESQTTNRMADRALPSDYKMNFFVVGITRAASLCCAVPRSSRIIPGCQVCRTQDAVLGWPMTDPSWVAWYDLSTGLHIESSSDFLKRALPLQGTGLLGSAGMSLLSAARSCTGGP